MFPDVISVISTFSIVIAAVLGVIRFSKVEQSYYPFIYICWLALLVEIVAYFYQTSDSTLWPSNVYVLLEGLLFTWQFQKWGSFNSKPWIFYTVLALITGLWVADNCFVGNIHLLSSRYRIGYSIVLVILAIDHINQLIVRERKSFVTNAKFLICIAVIVFFSYKLTTETFYLYALRREQSSQFVINIFAILKYVNLFTNLLFAYVVIWIPKKKVFLRPSR